MTGYERCKRYIAAVLDGSQSAPKTIIQACERFNRDLENTERFYFDDRAANVAVANIERLSHAKGLLQGTPIHLEDWQCFFICALFGSKWEKTRKRRFRRAYELVPRKNGKSLIAICIALSFFATDMEPGAEVYLGATSQDQAKDLLFNPAKYIVEKSKAFRKRFGIEVNASSLIIPANFSQLKSVIKKPDDGYNPHCAVVDEYHQHDTDEQYSTFDTGMGSREQPLLLVTSTAGSNLGGPCKEMHDECLMVLDGTIEDDSLFVLIYQPDVDDDWASPDSLEKVNPNIGVSVSRDYLLDQQSIARRSATAQNAFRTKHLNEWVGARVAWMNMLYWQKQKSDLTIEDFAGEPCFVSIDLASKKDLSAICILFKRDGIYYAFFKFYAPEAAVEEIPKYREFVTKGELTETPGNVTDYSFIEDELLSLGKDYDVKGFIFDTWQANYLITRMQDNRMPVIEMPMTVKNLSDAMKETEAQVLDGALWHNGNTCMTWQVGNVTAKMDARENIYPRKANKNDKNCHIDGPVTLIMAMSRWQIERDSGGLDDFLSNPVGV